MKKSTILIDFDGTCCTHAYPDVGSDIGAESVLKKLVAKGHRLILYTMRSGKHLDDAIKWFNDRDIPLYAVGKEPNQHKWTSSNKCHGDLVIDDRDLGVPLVTAVTDEAPYVDWVEVEKLLKDKGYI